MKEGMGRREALLHTVTQGLRLFSDLVLFHLLGYVSHCIQPLEKISLGRIVLARPESGIHFHLFYRLELSHMVSPSGKVAGKYGCTSFLGLSKQSTGWLNITEI